MDRPMRPLPHLYIDFDGTISATDTTDLILERFALPQWHAVEAAWERGEIGSRECMARQVSLLRATPQALAAMVEGIAVDPGFMGFVALCRQWQLPFTILSDGLDVVARGVLHRLGVSAPVLSNRMEPVGEDQWRLTFPYASARCATAAGNCKCACLEAGQRRGGGLTVLIGDGRSDFCGAGSADQVFAKGKLAAHCCDHAIPHVAFNGFTDLTALFHDWLVRTVSPVAAAE
jgi:2,3-diketo-5-methylthio-1-phosphopentane phosphatase